MLYIFEIPSVPHYFLLAFFFLTASETEALLGSLLAVLLPKSGVCSLTAFPCPIR